MLQAMLDEFNKTNPYGIKARGRDRRRRATPTSTTRSTPPSRPASRRRSRSPTRTRPPSTAARTPSSTSTPFIKSKKYGLSDDDLKDYFQTFLDSDANPQFKGERLGFPTQRSIEVMYYNVDWLKQLGYNEPPKDWKTWEEAACKASDASQNKYGWAFRHDASNFASQVFSRGGRILAPDGSAYVFNSRRRRRDRRDDPAAVQEQVRGRDPDQRAQRRAEPLRQRRRSCSSSPPRPACRSTRTRSARAATSSGTSPCCRTTASRPSTCTAPASRSTRRRPRRSWRPGW